MHSVASVAAVTSARRSQSVYRVSNPVALSASVQATKAAGNVQPSASSSSAQSTPVTAQSNLPLGLLLSVTQPAAGNISANTDYTDMENALRSGNLASAQQAYLRLQSDLMLAQPTAGNPASASGSALNITA